MKIGCQMNIDEMGSFFIEIFVGLTDAGRVKGELGIGVGGGNDIGRTGGGGDAQHFEAFIEGAGAVIDAGEDVGVDIDHSDAGRKGILRRA
jgi:hypothetical protein